MAFLTGTATSHTDLLDRLRLWLTGTVGWTQLHWAANELWIQVPGTGSLGTRILGFKAYDLGATSYGWELRGALSFDVSQGWSGQEQTSPAVYFNVWQHEMNYWFYGNTRRIIVFAKAGTNYISCYSGFFLPYALPQEYPHPLYIAGNYVVKSAYNIVSAGNRMVIDPGMESAWFLQRQNSTWIKVGNHTWKAGVDKDPSELGGSDPPAIIWPTRTVDGTYFSSSHWSDYGFKTLVPTLTGEGPIYHCQIFDVRSRQLVGSLDGLFMTMGRDRVSEQTVTSQGRTFRYFQNIYRTSPDDFCCVEEI